MTINLTGIWPKTLGALGIVFTILAMSYANSFVMIFGLTAFNFFSMLALIFNSVGTFISRQNNVSSEQVGAGIIPPENSNHELSQGERALVAQIAELQKKLEAK